MRNIDIKGKEQQVGSKTSIIRKGDERKVNSTEKERVKTPYKSKDEKDIHVGDRLKYSPCWSIDDLFCTVIDEATIKWEKATTLRTDLDYWTKKFYIV